ncbi:MAG: hypothetical protein Q9209_001682 [Squamulea sp. 1 TL-2023]
MTAFYCDSSRRDLFDERASKFQTCTEAATADLELLEWSPGMSILPSMLSPQIKLTSCQFADLQAAQAINREKDGSSRRIPMVFVPDLKLVYKSFAPLDLAHSSTGVGISALFDHYHIPPDFISQRLESVTHSFSAIDEGPVDSYFHFLCKHVTLNVNDRALGIADPRGTVLSQGDWTWIRTSVFMRWNNCNDNDLATVTLIFFSFSQELRDRCQRLWETDVSMVLVDPFSLFVICFDELWLQAQSIVRNVGTVFNRLERTALDLALSSTHGNGDGRHDFVGLHNVAKHIIYLKENSDAASLTMGHLQEFHRDLLKRPPQGQAAIPTMRLTSQMLAQKAVQFEVWKLRMSSMQQRMENIINLVIITDSPSSLHLMTGIQSFNVVIQHDSHILRNDSKSMKAIATVTMAFLPLATIAVRAQLSLSCGFGQVCCALIMANDDSRQSSGRSSSILTLKEGRSESRLTSGSSGP